MTPAYLRFSHTFLEIGLPGRVIKIAYAVDLGRQDIPLLADPDILSDVDYLIIGKHLRRKTA